MVIMTAMKPSRVMLAIITETHTIAPPTTDNRPTPMAVISMAAKRIVFLEPSLSDNKAIGMATTILAKLEAANAPSALAAVHLILRR
ncbi:unnamed protein product [marine sediment metagenome]|uniref:Uncharacterized protein n=1 Tax=marine sediment metagenome TaxID=412755 RepID=X1S1M2_9ZZZZ